MSWGFAYGVSRAYVKGKVQTVVFISTRHMNEIFIIFLKDCEGKKTAGRMVLFGG